MHRLARLLAAAFLLSITNGVHANTKVRLQLKWLHQFQFAGYYAAIEKGYYDAVGLDVELIEPDFDRDTVEPVISGDAEYGISSPDLILHRAKGEPVVALAAIYQHSPHALVALEGSGMESVHDLAGKRIMLESGTADLIALLLAEHIPLESIDFTPHTFSETPLIDGEVDALSAYITDEPYALTQRGAKPIIFNPRSAGIDFYGDGLFTSEQRIRKHPEEVKAFLEASLRGWEYALDHPEEIAQLIVDKYSQRKTREALVYEAERSVDLIRKDLVKVGYMHIGRWKHMADIYERVGMLEGSVDLEGMLYSHYTETDPLNLRYVLIITSIAIYLIAFYAWWQRRSKRKLEQALKRKEIEEEFLNQRAEDFRHFYEDAPLAFIIWDTELKVKYWNKSAEALFGWSVDEVTGKSASKFLVPETATDAVSDGKRRLDEGNSHSQINENLTKDGHVILCKWNNIPHKNPDGTVFEYHSIATDVTDEVMEKQALEAENRTIRSESMIKDQLLASTSHEIRTPLNAIMGYAQLLQKAAQDRETREMGRIMVEGAESMLNLLNNLLDSMKSDAGKMDLNIEDVDLCQLIQRSADLFRRVIEDKQLSLLIHTPQSPCILRTDAFRLGQILGNLLSNACKFTKRGVIRIELDQLKEPDAYEIVVSDTGVGMNSESLAKVFEPFSQANSQVAEEHGGTGLGLTLSKKLATLLNGELKAYSAQGQGSRFVLTLHRNPL